MLAKFNKRARRRAQAKALLEQFPAAFGKVRPLKIGIHHDIAEGAGATTSREFRDALFCLHPIPAYERSLIEGAARSDLDGAPCGAVTAGKAAAVVLIIALKRRQRAARPKPPSHSREPKVPEESEQRLVHGLVGMLKSQGDS